LLKNSSAKLASHRGDGEGPMPVNIPPELAELPKMTLAVTGGS